MIRFIKNFLRAIRDNTDAIERRLEQEVEAAVMLKESIEEQKKTRAAIERLCMEQESFMKTMTNYFAFEQKALLREEERKLEKEALTKPTSADLLY